MLIARFSSAIVHFHRSLCSFLHSRAAQAILGRFEVLYLLTLYLWGACRCNGASKRCPCHPVHISLQIPAIAVSLLFGPDSFVCIKFFCSNCPHFMCINGCVCVELVVVVVHTAKAIDLLFSQGHPIFALRSHSTLQQKQQLHHIFLASTLTRRQPLKLKLHVVVFVVLVVALLPLPVLFVSLGILAILFIYSTSSLYHCLLMLLYFLLLLLLLLLLLSSLYAFQFCVPPNVLCYA